MLTVISFIFVFGLVTVSHELGHLVWAKRAGIKVFEFGLGLGPSVFKFKRGGTVYSFNIFPIGGFVRLAGIDDEKDGETSREDEKFQNKSVSARIKAVLAGPLANIFLAFIIFFILYSVIGMPSGVSSEIGVVFKGTPAERVGLKAGDRIEMIDKRQVVKMDEGIKYIHQSGGKALVLAVRRGEKTLNFKVTPEYDSRSAVYLIGFSPKLLYERHNPVMAIWLGSQQTMGITLLILYSLWLLVTGQVSVTGVAGPLGIAHMTGQIAQSGFVALLQWAALISINLGIINLIPFPALDGGRLFFLVLEKLRGRPMDPARENMIHYIGFALLLALLAALTAQDVFRYFIK